MLHVGIDLGKRQSHACWITEDGEIKHAKVATTRAGLDKLLADKGGRVVLESCTIAEWVARHIESIGTWEVIVADPNFAPMYADRTRHVKTDRRDAEALMWACAKGNYRGAHRLSDEARRLRVQVRTRRTLVQMRAKLISQARSLMGACGEWRDKGGVKTFPDRWAALEVDPQLKHDISPLADMVETCNGPIAEIDRELERASRSDEAIRRLMTVPGVGSVTATTWVACLDRPDRFASADELVAYLGLVPREWSSSEVRFQGRITKRGPSELRWLLVECAWVVLTRKPAGTEHLREWAMRIQRRRGKNKGAVALARRLARILFVIWRDGTTYCPELTAGHQAATE